MMHPKTQSLIHEITNRQLRFEETLCLIRSTMSEVEAGLATRQIFLVKDAGRGVFKNGSAEQILGRGAGYYDDVKFYKELEYIEIGLTSEWFSDTDNEEDYEITNEISRQMKMFNL